MKIRVECRATVEVDVDVTDEQLLQLETGELELSEVVDESVPYDALRTRGEFEFIDWDRVQP